MPPKSNEQGALKRIHTYQSDVEEMMKKQQVSKATIAIAEGVRQVKQEKEEVSEVPAPPTPKPSKVFQISNSLPITTPWNIKLLAFVALGAIVLVGVGIGTYFYFKKPPTKVVVEPKTQIPLSIGVTLKGTEGRVGILKALTSSIKALSVPQNEIRIIPITDNSSPLTTEALLTKLDEATPPSLIRALGTTPTLGVHGLQGGKPFLLFSVSSYDYAFAGMLAWEETILDTLGPLFDVSSRNILQKVGSSTLETLQNTITVKDAIVRNKDVRAIFSPEGTIVFLYSFIDKQTLVVTTNEDTLKVLINRAGGGRLR